MADFSELHPEDVKARIRIAYGSTYNFERHHGLPFKSVSDVLRARSNARVGQLVNAFLQGELPSQKDA
jgi:hypothetical protein